MQAALSNSESDATRVCSLMTCWFSNMLNGSMMSFAQKKFRSPSFLPPTLCGSSIYQKHSSGLATSRDTQRENSSLFPRLVGQNQYSAMNVCMCVCVCVCTQISHYFLR